MNPGQRTAPEGSGANATTKTYRQPESYTDEATERVLAEIRRWETAARLVADDPELTVEAKCKALLEMMARTRRSENAAFLETAIWRGCRHLFEGDQRVPRDVIDANRRLLRRGHDRCPGMPTPSAFDDRPGPLARARPRPEEAGVTDPTAEDLHDEFTRDLPKLAPVETLTVPAPSNPYAVGKMFLEHHYPDDVVESLVRHHRNTFHRYDGTSWPEFDERRLESDLYRWLDGAKYWKKVKDDVELVDFEPTRYKIADLIDAIRANTHLDMHITTPAWIVGEDQGQVVPLANGLLTISTRKLIPHTPAYFAPHVLPFEYDRTAPTPGPVAPVPRGVVARGRAVP